MTLFEQFIATAFGVVHDLVSSKKPDNRWLGRYVYEAQQLRMRMADTRRDLLQIRDNPKLTKAQILDRVMVTLGRLELLEADLKNRDAVQNGSHR